MITERIGEDSGEGLMFRGISAGANGAGHSRTSQSADRPRGRLRRAAAAWLLACAAVLALPALPGLGGGVAHADVLVSNLGQTTFELGPNVSGNRDTAQAFTTGSSIRGYALEAVSVGMNETPPTASYFSVSVHESSGSEPGALRYTLTKTSAYTVGTNGFTAPAKAFLEGRTTYFVVFEYNNPTFQDQSVKLRSTPDNDEDAAGEDDWSIANDTTYELSGSWVTRTDSVKIRVNGSARDLPDITGVSIVSSPLQGDTYGRGETIEFEVTFDEPVVISSSGTLHASLFVGAGSGGTERRADYVPATDTSTPSTLRFRYTVQESDADSDGVAVGANALAVGGAADGSPKGGGTITSDATGFDADLSSDSMSFPNHKVDGSVLLVEPPGVTKIAISSTPANGAFFTDGEEILIDVDFSDTVTVSGDEVSLALDIGGGSQTASFVQVVENTSAQVNIHRLVFAYIVQPGDVDGNGIRVPANALAVSGTTTVRDRYDRDAVLTHDAFEFPDHLVNPPLPEITDIEIVSEVPDAGFYWPGIGRLLIEFEVTFSAPVTYDATSGDFGLKVLVGETERVAHARGGSGTSKLLFGYPVVASDEDTDGVSVPAGSLVLTGDGTLKGAFGQDADLTHGAYAFPQHLVNTPPPPAHLTGIEVDSSPGSDGFYATGDTIELHVTFSGRVTAAGNAPGRRAQAAGRRRREIR